MKWLFFLALPLLVVSCASKQALPSAVPPAPPRAASVAPEVSKLREQIGDADKSASVIATSAKDAAGAATAARSEAERLKNNRTANEVELTKLWQDLQSVEARNLFLETETSRLAANLSDARRVAGTLQEYAAAKDAENDQLRAGSEHLATMVGDYADQLNAANTAEGKERTRADKLSGEIRLYRIALSICGAVALAWVAAKLFLPRYR